MRLFAFVSLWCCTALAAAAPAPCTGFKWDVTKEVALFGGPSTALVTGRDLGAAPRIGTDVLYELRLAPQSDVTFVTAPGKKLPAEGAYAGVALLEVPAPGNYRVSVDTGAWIDVVANGEPAATRDFQGQQTCDGPHKIVELDLSHAREFILQLSGSAKPVVRLTVTPAPATALAPAAAPAPAVAERPSAVQAPPAVEVPSAAPAPPAKP